MKRFPRLQSIAVLVLAFLLALSGIATANDPRVQDDEDQEPDFFDAEESHEDVEEYWTPERLEAAEPPPDVVEWEPEFHEDAPPPDGPEEQIEPEEPTEQALTEAADPLGTATTTDLSPEWYSYPYPYTRSEVTAPYHQWPHSTHGRVFFTHGQWGTNHSCSATVVNASNRNTVWTAGHCVHSGGRDGAWHRNWVFIPAYRDGSAPFGMWSARRLWSLWGWVGNNNIRYDLGAVELNTRWGWRVQYSTGGQGLRANWPRNMWYTSFGYPAAWPFNGQRMIRCVAPWATNDGPWPWIGPRTMGKGCDVTGGASGGGWLTSWSQGGGYLQSVHSYKYWHQPEAVYGPYHGIGAWNLYWAAST